MRKILPALLLMTFGVESAAAQTTFSLQPPEVRAGQNVNLRIHNPSGCYPVPQIDVLRSGDVVTVNLLTTDAGECVPEWATPRLMPLGTFAPGQYQVQPFVCSNAPPPLPACQLRATLPLTVVDGRGARFFVPTLSGAVATGLAFVVMLLDMGAPCATDSGCHTRLRILPQRCRCRGDWSKPQLVVRNIAHQLRQCELRPTRQPCVGSQRRAHAAHAGSSASDCLQQRLGDSAFTCNEQVAIVIAIGPVALHRSSAFLRLLVSEAR